MKTTILLLALIISCVTSLKAQISFIIPDFQVNENAGPNGARQYDPSIAADSSGNCVIVWVDERNRISDIYAQQFSGDGTASEKNFKVNNDEGCNTHYHPIVSMDKKRKNALFKIKLFYGQMRH